MAQVTIDSIELKVPQRITILQACALTVAEGQTLRHFSPEFDCQIAEQMKEAAE